MTEHVSEHDMDRLYLGMISEEAEITAIEEHLLGCPGCSDRAEESDRRIDLLRRAIILGNFDLEFTA